MCIAVVGPSGDLVYFEKDDNCQFASITISQHKARTAARYRRPTVVFERLPGKGPFFAYLATLDDVIMSRGGNPLMVGGKMIGAIGVSGGTGSQDDVISHGRRRGAEVKKKNKGRHDKTRRDENPGGASLCIGRKAIIRKLSTGIALGSCLAALQLAIAPATLAKELKVISEKTVTGFGHVESVAYDPKGKVFYTSEFAPDLKPADKDGKGKITKVSADGKILEDGFLPAKGQVLNKPKGLWIKGDRLRATDIDSVWVFDLKTKEGKKLELPGIQFANRPDDDGWRALCQRQPCRSIVPRRAGRFPEVEKPPKITVVFKGKGVISPMVFIRAKAARC